MGLCPKDYALMAQEVYLRHEAATLDFQVGPVQAVFNRVDGAIVVALAGTDDGEDMLADVRFQPVWADELGCFVYDGAWRAARAAWTMGFHNALQAFGDVSIDFALHSLSGAIGVHLAMLMEVSRRPVRRVVAFNPLKAVVGALAFKLIGDRYHGFRHAMDPVSLWPPRLLHDWQHPDVLETIGKPDATLLDDHSISSCVISASTEELP